MDSDPPPPPPPVIKGYVTLIFKDGNYQIKKSLALESVTLYRILEDTGKLNGGKDDDNENLPVPDRVRKPFENVFKFMDKINKTETPEIHQEKLEELLNVKNPEYQENLFAFVNAAEYLDVQIALETSCSIIAKMIQGKTPDEIRTEFKLGNDFTEAEKAQLQLELGWLNLQQ